MEACKHDEALGLMRRIFERFTALLMLLALIFCGACGDSAVERLDRASQLVRERPDTAYAILRDLNYDDFDTDSLKARYVLTKAIANLRVGRSLVTDTLLDKAAEYFRESGDSRRWSIATQLLAGYDMMRGDAERGLQRLEAMLPHLSSPDMLWDTHIHMFELAFAGLDYPKAYEAADWLSRHTDRPEELLEFTVSKAAADYMQGRHPEALALMEDAIAQGLPDKAPGYRNEFYLEYAEFLNAGGRPDRALAIIDSLRSAGVKTSEADEVNMRVSEAEYLANAGDQHKARAILESINHEGTRDVFEVYSYIGMLKAAMQYRESGRFPSELMHRVSKQLHRSHVMAQYDRQKALESVIELNEDNYRLKLQRQRLWLLITGIALAGVVGGIAVYLMLAHRKRRMIEAEERAETLQQLLKDTEKAEAPSAASSDREQLKAVLLRQLGIFKIFAGTPTPQSRDALKKISTVGHTDGQHDSLVDWDEFYAMIDSLYDGFHSKLVNAYPGTFNDKEQQIIVLMKAGFSTKEIGLLTEQSSATIYTRKSVIRKKLGNPENGDLVACLDARFATP